MSNQAFSIRSHYAAGSGAVAVETREERRVLREIVEQVPGRAPIATIAAPSGELRDGRTGRSLNEKGLAAGYAWVAAGPGRVLVVYDWHTLANAPGSWRALIEALPAIRTPSGGEDDDPASLVVFVGPAFDFTPVNPLRGQVPIIGFAPPSREDVAAICDRQAEAAGIDVPADLRDRVTDALCGLSSDAVEQAAAEVLARGDGWCVDSLRAARRQELRSAGLELWEPVAELGGLSGFRAVAEEEVFPWIRDPQLGVRRILCAGVPGVGKSYAARWLAYSLGCDCVRLSIPSLKAGIVGASEGNLRRALRVIDAMAAHAPLVVVLDEVDTIARDGLDGGTSSGMFAELLTWLQESQSQAVLLATLNRLDKLDAALESRFQAQFFVDLPTRAERREVARIHFARVGCEDPEGCARAAAACTDGFSSREIAEKLVLSVARRTSRKPTAAAITAAAQAITPTSRTHADDLSKMRRAASALTRANDPADATDPLSQRRIGAN